MSSNSNPRVYDAILAVLDLCAETGGSPIDADGNLCDAPNQSDWSQGYTDGWVALGEMISDAIATTLSAEPVGA